MWYSSFVYLGELCVWLCGNLFVLVVVCLIYKAGRRPFSIIEDINEVFLISIQIKCLKIICVLAKCWCIATEFTFCYILLLV